MNLEEKLLLLESLYNKANYNIQYKVQVNWESISPEKLKTYIDNCRRYLQTMDKLDYDVREEGIANWHQKLDELLSAFPEYQNAEQNDNKKTK